MSDYFMGQIMMTGFPFAQRGFAQCNGTILAIRQNNALFSLLGITYGGDGQVTFALPDLRGRTPAGGGFSSADGNWQPPDMPLGAVGGSETVTLAPEQNPRHFHGFAATSDPATASFPGGEEVLAQTTNGATLYGWPANLVPLGGGPSSFAGSGAPHPNMQPYSVINFNIALFGVFPSRS